MKSILYPAILTQLAKVPGPRQTALSAYAAEDQGRWGTSPPRWEGCRPQRPIIFLARANENSSPPRRKRRTPLPFQTPFLNSMAVGLGRGGRSYWFLRPPLLVPRRERMVSLMRPALKAVRQKYRYPEGGLFSVYFFDKIASFLTISACPVKDLPARDAGHFEGGKNRNRVLLMIVAIICFGVGLFVVLGRFLDPGGTWASTPPLGVFIRPIERQSHGLADWRSRQALSSLPASP